ncbi:MAG: NAD(P)/FAD-dependent oxidoreductase [Acidobacteria bacterium]|nr:MAG: NAD(P)/FAD-dependent oxidoreductase [Acidobacteriota bacterium]
MDLRICRRDFLNSTLLASGSLLLGPLSPRELLADGKDWTGYGGIGDYQNSNGNTAEVMDAAHQIRDHVFDSVPANAIDTGEIFDCVVVGGGISGLAGALFFHNQTGGKRSCMVLENHPMFGGEAKRNEFMVDGQRLMAPQGSDHFQIPYPYSFIARFYDMIGIDWHEFMYQKWESASPEIPLGRTFEAMPSPVGCYFGQKFGQQPGIWLIDPWKNKFKGAPISAAMRNELLLWKEKSENPENAPVFDYPGDAASRRLDGITLEEHMMEQGLSRETIRTMLVPDEGGGFGLGPDVLSAYTAYAFEELHSVDDSPATGWHAFPGGNAGIARHIVKTLIPGSFAGPHTLAAICGSKVNFAALDRPGQPTRVRLGATVVRVEHETQPRRSQIVWVTYTQGGTVYRLKARSVVMAGGCWTTKLVVRDLPARYKEAYAQFYRSPCMIANVAVRNWRFLYKLGISSAQWFEGLGSFTSVHKVPLFGGASATIGPDSPTVITLKVLYCYPGQPIKDQGNRGRMELLSTSYRKYERMIREQLTEMFSQSGFDARRDIAGIVLNRWGHAYVNPQPGFFFGKDGKPAPREILRAAPFGRIAFANTDLSATPDHKTAVLEAHRAVGQVLDQVID